MTTTCGKCKEGIEANKAHMHCKGCGDDLHFDCGNYKQSSWSSISQKRKNQWRCEKCRTSAAAASNGTNQDPEEGGEEKLNVASVMAALNGFKDIVEEMKEENSRSMQFISQQYEDIMGGQNQIKDNIVGMEAQINNLTAQLKEKDAIIKDLQSRIADLEQYTRKNNIEIHGVSETRDEDVEEIVCNIGRAIGVNITEKDIEAAHRVPTRRKDTPQPIIVRFQSRKVKNQVMAKRKVNITNRQALNQENVSERNVVIYEQLSPFFKDLRWKAKQKAKEKDWKYVWPSGGKLWARKDENSREIRITCESDLTKIV